VRVKMILPTQTDEIMPQDEHTEVLDVTNAPEQQAPKPAPAPLELTAAVSSPDADRPTFVPLALAIDLGMTDPVGTIKTRSVLLGPSDAVSLNRRPQNPARLAAREQPGSGARVLRGPWTARAIPPMDPPQARDIPSPPPPGRPRLTLLPGLPE
jgi:hypothetical protein